MWDIFVYEFVKSKFFFYLTLILPSNCYFWLLIQKKYAGSFISGFFSYAIDYHRGILRFQIDWEVAVSDLF